MKMKQILVVVLATFVFNSCSDPPFQIGAGVILFQEIGEDEESPTRYFSLVQVVSNETMISCNCSHPMLGDISLLKVSDTYWRLVYEPTTTIPTGNFTVTATSIDQSATSVASITATDGMSEKLQSTLSYDPATREVTATFEIVSDATVYGIYVIQGTHFLVEPVEGYTAEQLETTSGSIKVTLPVAIENYAGGGYSLVAYAAKDLGTPIVQLGARVSITQ
jgi:hypothetical protein